MQTDKNIDLQRIVHLDHDMAVWNWENGLKVFSSASQIDPHHQDEPSHGDGGCGEYDHQVA